MGDGKSPRVTTAELRAALEAVRDTLDQLRAQIADLNADGRAVSDSLTTVRAELDNLTESVERLTAWAHTGNGRESASTRLSILEREVESLKAVVTEMDKRKSESEAAAIGGRWALVAAAVSALSAVVAAIIAAWN